MANSTPGWNRSRLLVAAVAALVLGSGAAVVASLASGGDPPSGAGRNKPSLAAPAGGALAEPDALPATSFDPFGDDKAENQAGAANVSDGDPRTAWKTSSYQDNFPKLKPGVGVYVDLGRNQKVRSVDLTATAGYNAEVFVADRPSADLAGWGKPRAAGGNGSYALGGVGGRYVLVWFTSLPPTDDGGYRVEVAELKVDRG